MTKSKALLLGMSVLIVLAVPAFADQCLTSIDASTSVTTNVTTGTNVQISTTPSGECSGGEITLQLAYSNCSLTITDPSSPGYYSGVSTGTAKTFTVTSGSSGICTITARGTTSDGSVDSNTPVILEFIDPAALTTAGTTSASVTYGSTFNLGINISNPQASDALTSYTLTLPSGLTRSSGDLLINPSITADAGGTKPLSWVVSHSTCFTGSKTITLQVGDNSNAFSLDVSGNASCSTSSSSSSSSSNSGSGLAGTTNETKLFSTIAGASNILPFTVITSPGITQMEIKTINGVAGVQVILAAAIKPTGAADIVSSTDGKVYSYMELTDNQDDSVYSLIKIKFKVPAVWVSANGIDYTKMYLYRYSGGAWSRLDTTFKSNDTASYFYEAVSPGFSTFAIAGYKPAATVPVAVTSGPSMSIVLPTSGLIVRNDTVVVQLSASGITLATPKTTLVSGEGHFRVWLDGAERNTTETSFAYTNVSEGSHTLKAELVKSDGTSFSPVLSSTIMFSVEKPLVVQAPPFVMPDMTVIGIIVVIIIVIGAGVYFAFFRDSFRIGGILSRMPRRPTRIFEDAMKRRRYDDRSFSRGYEYRGESRYSNYNPDSVEFSGDEKDKNDLDE